MLQEQLDQVESTGLHAFLIHPMAIALTAVVVVAILAASYYFLLKTDNYLGSMAIVAVAVCIMAGHLMAFVTDYSFDRPYVEERSGIVKSFMADKYGLTTEETLQPDSLSGHTRIIVSDGTDKFQVRPEIDDQGELTLWSLDGTEFTRR